ncbi:MAG: 2-phospho-L-lactate transferase [Methanobacteriaceae archaeon]|nr:2-phospho-L-lactate transferase [Methanobacteriaceae archaeon]
MITVLSGGTGTPKLLQGIVKTIDPDKINVIVNTVENTYVSNLYIAADIDTVLYTLAGIINEETWYGIHDDSFITHEMLKKLGCPELLRIGDRDRAIKIQKTLLMEKCTLSQAVNIQRKNLGVKSRIIPMSNDQPNINIITDQGNMKFHEFLIEHQGKPDVLDIEYTNVVPSEDLIVTIEDSEMIIIGPSNPVTSIGPIISMEGVVKALKNSYVVAVSPIIGGRPVSGPAAKFMKALGFEVSCVGVANMYANFLDKFIIDVIDSHSKEKIEKLISKVCVTNTNMKTINDKVMLARTILGEII